MSAARRVPALGVGVGLIAGAFEAVQIGARLALSLSVGEALLLSVSAAVCGGIVGAALGLGVGLFAQWRWSARAQPWALATSMALVTVGVAAFYLGFAAKNLLDQGRTLAAVAFALSPLGLAGVVYFNAHYWLRREEVGEEYRLGWRGVSALAALGVCLINALIVGGRGFGGDLARASAPDVLLITIDTLRRDHISAYGESPVQTPNIDALAARGVLFEDAVTPFGETAPAHAAMLSGRHPFRSGVLSNGDHLKNGTLTLAEQLHEDGYATAAFVSSFAVNARVGLDQGFEIYDDDFLGGVRGASRIRLVQLALRAFMRFGDPADLPQLYERAAPVTYAHALDWLASNRERPVFVWVHTFEPHSPYEPHGLPGFEDNGSPAAPALDHKKILAAEPGYPYTDPERARLKRLYAEEVAYADQQLGLFLSALDAQARPRPRVIVLAGDHGESLGEHGVDFTHHGLYEPVVRVPLVLVPPDMDSVTLPRVPYQVRLMDIATTLTDLAGVESLPHTEGFPLMVLAEGNWPRGIPTLLLGRRGVALSEGLVYGYRSGGVKYHLDPISGVEQIFDVNTDPGELSELSAKIPELLVTARERVRDETRGKLLQPATGEVDEDTKRKLEAMGYVQ